MVDLTKIDEAADVVKDALDEMVKGLRATIEALAAKVEEVEAERDELKERLDGWDEENAWELAKRDEVLEVVKYWLHDIFYTNKPSPCPRQILRKIEDAL